ncbi:hypothetical protein PLESTB_001470800 [Pleodorina starrii]|uniref:Uncharacterized protein n=1 Tax=Pleodorina starrii TaxID=330485 RepID=A0A9W6BW20_9CHLO|nr:hypothetical protein PLESTM_001689000 [Pleodorina starrii]GLC59289.1 hypothetical protein PLESTB_001470800 [Pleodorina starrii]GLC74851.1 hypothetical protein PLESTF_001563200 [Pleodorina starrii]
MKVVGWNPTVRSRLEKFRWVLFVSVPFGVGFGLGRIPEFWEAFERWHPSAATNAKGPYLPKELTEHRPTLQSEYSALVLEAALDAALEEARKANASTAKQ